MKKYLILWFFCLIFWSGNVVAEDCPATNKIVKLNSNNPSFKAVQPLDFSQINSSGAYLSKDGTKVKVCLSNGKFKIPQMANDFVLPIKSKDEFIAVINFVNAKNPIVPGQYSATAGYGKPFWAFAEIKLHKGEKGVIVSLGVVQGIATILKMTEKNLCGYFDLKNKKGDSYISGEFNMAMEKSRW